MLTRQLRQTNSHLLSTKTVINGFDTPVVYTAAGPYEPTTPVTVQTEEMKNMVEALGLPSDFLEDNYE